MVPFLCSPYCLGETRMRCVASGTGGGLPYYPLCPGLHCWLGPLGVSGFVWVLVIPPRVSVQVPLICVTVVVGARVLEV